MNQWHYYYFPKMKGIDVWPIFFQNVCSNSLRNIHKLAQIVSQNCIRNITLIKISEMTASPIDEICPFVHSKLWNSILMRSKPRPSYFSSFTTDGTACMVWICWDMSAGEANILMASPLCIQLGSIVSLAKQNNSEGPWWAVSKKKRSVSFTTRQDLIVRAFQTLCTFRWFSVGRVRTVNSPCWYTWYWASEQCLQDGDCFRRFLWW